MKRKTTEKTSRIDIGQQMMDLIAELYPIARSITGDGVRESLAILKKHIPLKIHEIPTGTQVFDWEIPKEWNIKDAYIKNSNGDKVVDFSNSNLHVLNYSQAVNKRVSKQELSHHIHTLPEHPDWIPYRTSYYTDNWGFCMTHNQWIQLPEGDYEVVIDSELKAGHLTYGEFYLPGKTEEEVLFSSHICHPSLCNDNLSGIAIAVMLAKQLQQTRNHLSYRFIFAPATIGAITWLALNKKKTKNISHGLILTLLGDPGKIHYKRSKWDNSDTDRVVEYVLKNQSDEYAIREFIPWGYDERQYCSPGINLPIGCLMRTPNGEFPQYHTSADNLDFIQADALIKSHSICTQIIKIWDSNCTYINLFPNGEPQLGKRDIYQQIGGDTISDAKTRQLAMLWVLTLSDGSHDLFDIAIKSKMNFEIIRQAANRLKSTGLIEPVLKNDGS